MPGMQQIVHKCELLFSSWLLLAVFPLEMSSSLSFPATDLLVVCQTLKVFSKPPSLPHWLLFLQCRLWPSFCPSSFPFPTVFFPIRVWLTPIARPLPWVRHGQTPTVIVLIGWRSPGFLSSDGGSSSVTLPSWSLPFSPISGLQSALPWEPSLCNDSLFCS